MPPIPPYDPARGGPAIPAQPPGGSWPPAQ
jgi:hypothetical protein